jgi:enediyne biosynthesis protein E8
MEPGLNPDTTSTLEAFADTIVPGNKRYPEDRAIAGVSEDAGAVEAGALDLLQSPAGGLAQWLPGLAQLLNGHAQALLQQNGSVAEESVPPFVRLSYEDRAALILRLTTQDNPERQAWVNLAMFSNMAFDSAAHLHTTEALEAGHPGLLTLGFAPPDVDGLWRFPEYSYGRTPAAAHPATTPAGNPS